MHLGILSALWNCHGISCNHFFHFYLMLCVMIQILVWMVHNGGALKRTPQQNLKIPCINIKKGHVQIGTTANSNLTEKNLKQKRRMCFPSLVLKWTEILPLNQKEQNCFHCWMASNNGFSAMGTKRSIHVMMNQADMQWRHVLRQQNYEHVAAQRRSSTTHSKSCSRNYRDSQGGNPLLAKRINKSCQ